MKKTIILFVVFCCFSCENNRKTFDIRTIDITQYQPLSDSTIMQRLIYNNPEISGWNKLYSIYFSRGDSANCDERDVFKKKFDELFWKKTKNKPLEYNFDVTKEWRYFPIHNPMAYIIIDSIKLKSNYGFLILKYDEEEDEFKQLYLSVYNQEKIIETYLVSEKYGNKHNTRIHSDKIKKYSDLYSDRWLMIHFHAKDFIFIDSENYNSVHFDSLYIRSTYDLEKQKLIKLDTIVGSRKGNSKNNNIPKILIDAD